MVLTPAPIPKPILMLKGLAEINCLPAVSTISNHHHLKWLPSLNEAEGLIGSNLIKVSIYDTPLT